MLVENWHFAFVSSLCLSALVAMIFEMGFKKWQIKFASVCLKGGKFSA